MRSSTRILTLVVIMAVLLSMVSCNLVGTSSSGGTSTKGVMDSLIENDKTEAEKPAPDQTAGATDGVTDATTAEKEETIPAATTEPVAPSDPDQSGEDTSKPADPSEPPKDKTDAAVTDPVIPPADSSSDAWSEDTTVPERPTEELPPEDTTVPPAEDTNPPEKTTEETPSEPQPPVECIHEWDAHSGQCNRCWAYCEHGAVMEHVCIQCGMVFPTHFQFYIYQDGVLTYEGDYSEVLEYISLRFVVESTMGISLEAVQQNYRIYYLDAECTENTPIYPDAHIYLETIVHEPPETIRTYRVLGVFYPHPEWMGEGGDDGYDWFGGYKDLYYEFQSSVSAWELLQFFAINPTLHDLYLNGEKVDDLENTYLTQEQSLIFVISKYAGFKPYTVTVRDLTGESEQIKTYVFDSPMFYSQIKDQILAGMPDTALSVFVEGYHDSMYGSEAGAPFVKDTIVTVSISKTTVRVERIDSKDAVTVTEYAVMGTVPNMAEFAKSYLGITDFSSYAFFTLTGGSVLELQATDLPDYSIVAVERTLIPDRITVAYQVSITDPYGGGDRMEYVGSFEIDRPMTLAQAFGEASLEFYLDFGYGSYQITLNGVEMSGMEKDPWFILICMDSQVEIRSANRLWVFVEDGDGMIVSEQTVMLEDLNITVGELAAMLGVDFSAYTWIFNGSMFGDMQESIPVRDLFMGSPECALNLIPKRISLLIRWADEQGLWQEQEMSVVGTSITMGELAAMLGMSFDSFMWSLYDPYTYTDIGNVTADTVLTALPAGEWEQMRYEIKAIATAFVLFVQINNTGEVHELRYDAPVSFAEVLAVLGYSPDMVGYAWFEDVMNGGGYPLMADSILFGGGRIVLDLYL